MYFGFELNMMSNSIWILLICLFNLALVKIQAYSLPPYHPSYAEEFIATLSNTLNSAYVPCVLWGHCLLNVHGVSSIIGFEWSIDVVVTDDQLQTSTKALSTCVEQLEVCPQSEICPSGSHDRYTPPPAFHMHIVDAVDVAVGLYIQSDMLRFLPPLENLIPPLPQELEPTSSLIVASNDAVLPAWRPGRGSGVFDASKQYRRVVIPRAAVLLEAFLRLYVPNTGKQIGSFAMAMIDYMELYVAEDGFLDATLLPDPLGSVYQQLKDEKLVRQWTNELKVTIEIS